MSSPHSNVTVSTGVTAITHGEIRALRLAAPSCTLDIAMQGAHVLGWSPRGVEPVLFMSPRARFKSGVATRGGVPLCFPWFGPRAGDSRAPAHGFARIREWAVESAEIESNGSAAVVMLLRDDVQTRAAWPHAFEARLRVRAGDSLHMALEIGNTGDAPFTFEAALHTYLAVSDVRRVAVHGLENVGYFDRVGAESVKRRQPPGPLVFSSETNRLYFDTSGACVIDDPAWRRRITVGKGGSTTTVVWNPWADTARTLTDLGDEAWTGMVCIEAANAAVDAVTLPPGISHVLETTISVSELTH